ncbi:MULTISPECIES: helix-turn-helix transcriptional regulator [Bacillaceae]|uniref:ArsR family transcriptional regulator n=1 Tax=Evansella alkalicola TaxID=745819 RepID=A0ABS6JUF5_9BACI|nr:MULTISPECIES: ArsR family transcriptional regulator [Bacillaceae]MBU9722133.1 ArsR family transcriptional regulator [Bacillus alkalicola]
MATKTTSTREQILSLLKRERQLTVSAIAHELDITEMAVRRHLNTLERDDIVETTLLRQAMGRPTNVYQLSHSGQEMFPRDYATLAIELLKNLEELDGATKVKALFDMRTERIKKKYEKRMFLKDFQEKLYEIARLQNENGFMAEVTEEPDGTYVLKQFNCPIAEVAKEFPVVCECEKNLLTELLNAEVQVINCMATGQDGHCYYKISPK